jgi:hypothetical protein
MQTRHFIVSLILALPAFAETQLPPNARVAIIGDSITEQKLYSRFIETYLLGCTGRKDIRCFQFGSGGETAQGFGNRLENDLSVFHPTVATTCYGMNDGRYVPYNPSIGASYEKWMRRVLEGLKKVGVTHIVAGSPGAVDTRWFMKPGATADQYNDTLAHLRDIAPDHVFDRVTLQPVARLHRVQHAGRQRHGCQLVQAAIGATPAAG